MHRRITAALVSLLPALWIAACQQAPKPPAAATPVAAPPPMSPLQAFVTTAEPGQSQIVDDAQMGQVRATVLKEYPAASGEYCRRFGLEIPDRPGQMQIGITCYDGVSWGLVKLQP
ncbi:DVU3141 family protein [Dongia sp.]|uniref:DVU3141 family protein n=1 Tax=Dongia sp. TaxID=1977262 RepID=UPI003750CEB5